MVCPVKRCKGSLLSNFGKNKRGSWDCLEKIVVQYLLVLLLLLLSWERHLYHLAAAFKIFLTRKQSKVCFCSLYTKPNLYQNRLFLLFLWALFLTLLTTNLIKMLSRGESMRLSGTLFRSDPRDLYFC